LSTTLFNLTLEYVVRKLQVGNPGVTPMKFSFYLQKFFTCTRFIIVLPFVKYFWLHSI